MFPQAIHKLGVIFFPAFDWAIAPNHPEREERLLYTQDQLYEEGLFDIPGIQEFKPAIAQEQDVKRVHFCLPNIDAVCTPSHFVSAGGAIQAVDCIMSGMCDRAFVLVRPPGHHAMRVTYGTRGFCNINTEAIMLEYLRHTYNKQYRVAIVDTDCHHGDGTQDIYWNDPNTLFISLHQDGHTVYPGTGFLYEYGGPAALGKTVNIPLPPGTGDEGYLYIMKNVVMPILQDFKPDFVINSAGQDNHYTDPLTNMYLTAEGYAQMTEILEPDLVVLEGGYSIQGGLPYINLGICLALAGLSFKYLQEPDRAFVDIQQPTRVTEVIKACSEDVLKQYFNPPERPYLGKEIQGWWVREKEISYDTVGVFELQKESIRLCSNCFGLIHIETQSKQSMTHCVFVPNGVCLDCQKHMSYLQDTWGKDSSIFVIDQNKQ